MAPATSPCQKLILAPYLWQWHPPLEAKYKLCIAKISDWFCAARITQVCVCLFVFVLEREIKRGIICMCVHACPVNFVALYLAGTLLCCRCQDGLYHIIHTANLITVSAFALFWSLSHHLSHPGAWVVGETSRVTAMLTGSSKCAQAASGAAGCRSLFDTSSLVLQRFEGWGRTGARSQQFPGQPLSRVNYYTNQMLLLVMVSALVIHASFTHLAFFYAYLSFIMWCLWDTWVCRALQVCSSGATVWGV